MGLGFRQAGLSLSVDDQEQICEILHASMNARKKSKLRSLTGMMSTGSGQSREAAERNRAWHTAELAAALYQLEDGAEDVDSDLQLTPSISSAQQEDGHIEGYEDQGAQSSSSQVGK
jgi:hypothetical protein